VRTPRGGWPHAPLGMATLWGDAAAGAESRRRAWLRPVRPELPRVRAATAAPEARMPCCSCGSVAPAAAFLLLPLSGE